MLNLLTALGASIGVWLYVAAAGLAFGESALLVGVVLPGETALLLAGYYSHQGVLHLAIMLPLAIVAAIVGDSVGFELGRRYGSRVRASGLGRRVGDTRWVTVDGLLRRHGRKAALFARLAALLRAVTPSMAGMSGMRRRTLLVWNVLGGVIWGGGCVLLGWAFASALSRVGHYLTWGPLALLLLLGLCALALHRRRRTHDDTVIEVDTDHEPALSVAAPRTSA
jgi:membrane-associated protein